MAETRSTTWTVMTWNIHGLERPSVGSIAAVIRAAAPDVVCLQEVQRPQAEELAASLSMRFTWAFKHQPLWPFAVKRSEGMAILTPHGLQHPGHTELSDAASRRSWRRRIGQWALVTREDASAFRVYNLHFSPHDLVDERVAEARRLATIATEHGDVPPAIVAGDFNSEVDDVVEPFSGSTGNIDPLGPPTCPSDAPTQRLDRVLVPATAYDVSTKVPEPGRSWTALSDHLPMTCTFATDWVAGDWVTAPTG